MDLTRTLPSSYKDFLQNYGAIGISDFFVSGVINDNAEKASGGNIINDTNTLRENGAPDSLIVISMHEDGAYCLDYSKITPSGDIPVVNFEFGSIQHETPVAQNFSKWLKDFFLLPFTENE